MFIARLYLDRAIALPSDSLNEPAIQPTDTISGARPTSHLGVYFSLSLSLSLVYYEPYTPILVHLLETCVVSAIDTH